MTLAEIWKPINGFELHYEISNNGKVKSLKTGKGKWGKELNPLKHKYLRVCLKIEGKAYWKSIHRLVAEHYIDNPDPVNFVEVNHEDGNKWNNWYWNLKWITPRGNKDHAVVNRLYAHGEKHGRAKLTNEQVKEIHSWLTKRVRTIDLAEKYNVHRTTIEEIKTASHWTHLNLPKITSRGLAKNRILLFPQ